MNILFTQCYLKYNVVSLCNSNDSDLYTYEESELFGNPISLDDENFHDILNQNSELMYYFDDNIHTLNLKAPNICVISFQIVVVLLSFIFEKIYMFECDIDKKEIQKAHKFLSLWHFKIHYNNIRHILLIPSVCIFIIPIIFTLFFQNSVKSKTQFSLYIYVIYFIVLNIPNYYLINIINNPNSKPLFQCIFLNIFFMCLYLICYKYNRFIIFLSILLSIINALAVWKVIMQYKINPKVYKDLGIYQIESFFKNDNYIIDRIFEVENEKNKIQNNQTLKYLNNELNKIYKETIDIDFTCQYKRNDPQKITINYSIENIQIKIEYNHNIIDFLLSDENNSKYNLDENQKQTIQKIKEKIDNGENLDNLEPININLNSSFFIFDYETCLFKTKIHCQEHEKLVYDLIRIIYLFFYFSIIIISAIYFYDKNLYKKIINKLSSYLLVIVIIYILIFLSTLIHNNNRIENIILFAREDFLNDNPDIKFKAD